MDVAATRPRQRLLVVSNRLPIVLDAGPEQDGAAKRALVARPGSGGLVSALLPVLRHRGGTWVGWAGLPTDEGQEAQVTHALEQASGQFGFALQGVPLSGAEVRDYYEGFSNRVLWPLFHDLPERCRFEPAYFDAYVRVNERFAEVVLACGNADLTWIHDYQLIGVAAALRARGMQGRLGFFLHIPFPPPDLYLRLPWRFQILRMLLAHDLIGFQTLRDRTNFIACVRKLLPEVKLVGRGHLVAADRLDSANATTTSGAQARIGVFPISIDDAGYVKRAQSATVRDLAQRHRSNFPPDRQLILGVDRLDYTKGIPERLRAFDLLLAQHPELIRRVTLIQVMVPSREDIAEYASLKAEIDRLVSEINGRYTAPGDWVPVQYVYRPLAHDELIAWYRCCQIALITPLKDGMNLVAKEFCACSVDEDAVLILSEFAGAAAQLHGGALIVNPHDIGSVAAALHNAVTMPLDERRSRMRRLRRQVASRDVFWWVNTFLRAAIAKDLSDFPQPDDYVPTDEAAYSVV
jgi:trehalose 6-phosphate synthase/phosphatase